MTEGVDSQRSLLVPAVKRASAILDAIMKRHGEPMSLTELATGLGIPKSSMANLCTELVDARLLRRTDGLYRLGPKVAELGMVYLASVDVVREFQDVCNARSADINETIKLALLGENGEVIYLARHDISRATGLMLDIRVQQPAHCTASGKAMLACLSPAALNTWLLARKELIQPTSNSICSISDLRRELELIRERKYATDEEECIEGIFCVGTAVARAYDDENLYGLSFAMLSQRATKKHVIRLAKELDSLATEFTSRLGDSYLSLGQLADMLKPPETAPVPGADRDTVARADRRRRNGRKT